MSKRKALKQGPGVEASVASTAEASDEEGDSLFAQFVSIVDNLLGDHLPENIVNDFVNSADFETYRAVLDSPETTDEETRAQFYSMVDDQLGNMSPESIKSFVESDDFNVYRAIGEQYKDE
jgi:hypothetical protein